MTFDRLDSKVSDFLEVSKYSLESCLFHSENVSFSEDVDNVKNVAVRLLFEIVKPFYDRIGYLVNNAIYNFLAEPLKNANFYGNRENNLITFNLYLTPSALVASYDDGGDFFKREEIKRSWEERTFKKSYEGKSSENIRDMRVLKQVGFGAGLPLIFDTSDLIYVDNLSGRLYTGLRVINGKYRLFEKK